MVENSLQESSTQENQSSLDFVIVLSQWSNSTLQMLLLKHQSKGDPEIIL